MKICEEDALQMLTAGTEPKNYLVRNHYYFNDEINTETARNMIISLHEVALSIVNSSIDTGSIPCPICLHLNSPGGSLTDALQVIQVIKDIQSGEACKIGNARVPIEVWTYIEGESDSGASLIAAVGSKRFCSRYAMSLIHPMRSIDANFKTVEEQKVQMSNNEKWNKIYVSIYLEHSKLTEAQITEMMKTETYYTPEELLSFGLIEEII